MRALVQKVKYPDDMERPRTRAECAPCEACQAFESDVDRGLAAPGTRPACGHDPATALFRCRPCPFVACPGHLYTDVNRHSGAVKVNFPHLEPCEIPETCAYDVADRGVMTLDSVGELMNLTRERIRQVEAKGVKAMRVGFRRMGLAHVAREWLLERMQAGGGEVWPVSVERGDGPALLAMIADWEARAGQRLADAVWQALGQDECAIPTICKRLPGEPHRPAVQIALDTLEGEGRVRHRMKKVSTGRITVYRRTRGRRGRF